MTAIICLVISLIYFLWVTYIISGWSKLFKNLPETKSADISIIVPFRNEEHNLPKLIASLENQKNTAGRFEVIFINDNSEDGSVSRVVTSLPHKLLQLEPDAGKKKAILHGINSSEFDWIVTVDADVVIGENWLSTIQKTVASENPDLLIMPVRIDDQNSWLGKLQSIEFMGIMGITAGSIKNSMPLLCNGANLAFRKDAWNSAIRSRLDMNLASGDDMFLLQEIKGKGKICWLHDRAAIAVTEPQPDFRSLLSQRIRWASKSLHFSDRHILASGILVTIANVLLPLMLILAFTNVLSWGTFFLCVLLKIFPETYLSIAVMTWMNKKSLIASLPFFILFHPFYVITVLGASLTMKPDWKGRKIY